MFLRAGINELSVSNACDHQRVHFLFAWASGVKRSVSGEGLGYVCRKALELLCKQELESNHSAWGCCLWYQAWRTAFIYLGHIHKKPTSHHLLSLKNTNELPGLGCGPSQSHAGPFPGVNPPSQVTKSQLSKLKSDSGSRPWRLASDPHSSVCSEERLCTQVIWTALWGCNRHFPLCPLVKRGLGTGGDVCDPPRFLFINTLPPSISQTFNIIKQQTEHKCSFFICITQSTKNIFSCPNWSNLALQTSWYASKLKLNSTDPGSSHSSIRLKRPLVEDKAPTLINGCFWQHPTR